jgi:hypothetical protein
MLVVKRRGVQLDGQARGPPGLKAAADISVAFTPEGLIVVASRFS